MEQLRSAYSFSKIEIGDHSVVQMGDSVAEDIPTLSQKHTIPTLVLGSGKNVVVSMGNLHGRKVFDKAVWCMVVRRRMRAIWRWCDNRGSKLYFDMMTLRLVTNDQPWYSVARSLPLARVVQNVLFAV